MRDKNIHILSVCTSDVSGGAARAAYRIHQSVRQLGVDSKMFVKNKGSQDPNVYSLAEFVPSNILYRATDWCAAKVKNKIQHYHWNKYPNRDKNFKSDLRGTRLHGALQSIPYDILHLHWINQRFVYIDELRKVGKPIVWTLHDSWPFCGICHYFLDCEAYQHQCGCCTQLASADNHDLSHRVWTRKAEIYKNLDLHIVAPSRWLADCARKSSLFSGLDIRVIPNCLDTELFRPMTNDEITAISERQTNTLIKGVWREANQEKRLAKPMILYGAVNAATDRIKGFASLLSALQLIDQQGVEANLVVFGANETDLPMQFEHISVTFVGYITDSQVLTALYNVADVMVVPSLTENLSCAIMESLSCGTPVCCFDIGGNSDMVDHQVNGYLAAEKDSNDLAKGIQWCLFNNKDNVLGIAARESVLSRFTEEKVATQYIALYNELMN